MQKCKPAVTPMVESFFSSVVSDEDVQGEKVGELGLFECVTGKVADHLHYRYDRLCEWRRR